MTAIAPALVEAARAGDRDAIVRLVALVQPDVRRYAQRACRTTDAIDDAVQDTLFLLYRHIGSLRSIAVLPAWLMTVVTRQCLRLLRLAGPRTEDIDTIAEAELASRPADELRIDLVDAVQSLPPQYRDIVILRDIEEMTIDEIAQRLALTREAIKGRLNRARALLREYLSSGEQPAGSS